MLLLEELVVIFGTKKLLRNMVLTDSLRLIARMKVS